jgi:hypothetical protein
MAVDSRLGTISRMTGVAASSAPLVRRMARDEELRGDVLQFISSANQIVRDVATDKQLRKDVRRLIRAARSGRARIGQEARPRTGRWLYFFGAGVVFGTLAVAGALLYPRSRRSVVHAAGQTRQRASATVHDIRERYVRRSTGSTMQTPAAGSDGSGEDAGARQAA